MKKQNKNGPEQYRQGDVFIVKVDEIPKTAVKQKGAVILEYGEVTGHCHQVVDTTTADLYLDGTRKYLEVCLAASVTHEEHSPINLKPGLYEVRRQCTWSSLEQLAQVVAD